MHWLSGLTVAVALAASATACGGGGAGEDVATLGGGATTSTTGGGSTDPEDAMVAFTSCMREHGVDLPDPQTAGDGGFVVQGPPRGSGGSTEGRPAFDDPDAEKAQAACGHLLDDAVGDLDISPEEEAKMRDEALAFAACIREHGVDMPDPTFSDGGRVEINVDEADGGEGPPKAFDDPDFEAANEACADKLGGGIGARRAIGRDGGDR